MLDQLATYIRAHYAAHFSVDFCYHNITHTERVVRACEIISDHCEVDNTLRQHILAAAWFHDAGYYLGAKGHEAVGAELAKAYFETVPDHSLNIPLICELIAATAVEHHPQTMAERVIADADLHYLGQTTFFDHADLLRKEWELKNDTHLSDADWYRTNIAFLEKHTFYTPFAQRSYGPAKFYNLKATRRRFDATESSTTK